MPRRLWASALAVALIGATALAVATPAYAADDPFQLKSLQLTPNKGPAPLLDTLTAVVDNPRSTPVTYTFDFGDGSAPMTSGSATVQHTYTSPSEVDDRYVATVTATLPSGATFTTSSNVQVTTPFTPIGHVRVAQVGPLSVRAYTDDTMDPWQIVEYAYDYGDGTVVRTANPIGDHAYAALGTYTISLTTKDFAGNVATDSQQVTISGAYYPVAPQRLLDTRDGGGPLGPGGQTSLQVTGAHGVPAGGVTAVVLNLTATNPTADSFLSVFPSGGANPGTSNVNFAPGQTVPNLVTVPVGPDGKVVIANHTGRVDVVVDLEGYYRTSPAEQGGSFLNPTVAQRLMDTRDGTGGVPKAPIGPGGRQVLNVTTYMPEPVAAVALNVTVTNPTASSFLTVFPNGGATPTASNLNYRPGQTVSNLVIVPVSAAGEITFVNHAGNADVIADVEGYYLTMPNGRFPTTAFTPVAPSRVLDTRDGTGGFQGPIPRNETIGAPVGSIPSSAKAVVLNVTVVNGTADSYLTVGGGFVAGTSNLNFGPGQTKQVLVIAALESDGRVRIYNHVGSVDVIADVFGYFA
ncbi:PKD domain-containing protein [Kutzneria sp. NPDC052558]|uniref:PKD domain-containing protein n=1 Tax=Kutzneria sp. NPDC052558 TaxID=3364121 RepID=UPI0037C6C328